MMLVAANCVKIMVGASDCVYDGDNYSLYVCVGGGEFLMEWISDGMNCSLTRRGTM